MSFPERGKPQSEQLPCYSVAQDRRETFNEFSLLNDTSIWLRCHSDFHELGVSYGKTGKVIAREPYTDILNEITLFPYHDFAHNRIIFFHFLGILFGTCYSKRIVSGQ
jgi:hypothetical protein